MLYYCKCEFHAPIFVPTHAPNRTTGKDAPITGKSQNNTTQMIDQATRDKLRQKIRKGDYESAAKYTKNRKNRYVTPLFREFLKGRKTQPVGGAATIRSKCLKP